MAAKLTFLVAIISGHVTAWLPPIVRFMTKQIPYGQRHYQGIDNAFDHRELCFVLYAEKLCL